MRQITITDKEESQRLDKFLLKLLNTASKSFIYKMLRKKNIKLNDKKATGNEILTDGDVVKIFFSEETFSNFTEEKKINLRASDISIIYEDENILLVNKPFNVLSHSEKQEDNDTLIDRILNYLYRKNEFSLEASSSFTPALANRLDQNTTGIVVAGKNLKSLQALNLAFKERSVTKKYYALVSGAMTEKKEVVCYHKKTDDNKALIFFEKKEDTKEIRTSFTPIKTSRNVTLLEIDLFTGKSHQIRAVLQAINFPILGDTKYGDKNLNQLLFSKLGVKRQLLHSYYLSFNREIKYLEYLNGKEFVTNMPADFLKALEYFHLM